MEREDERVLRVALGALLDSSLTRADVDRLAFLLSSGRDFPGRLADLLRDVSNRLGSYSSSHWSSPTETVKADRLDAPEPARGVVSLVLGTIRQKKYSKQRLAAIMRQISGSRRWQTLAESATIKALVEAFVESSSEADLDELLRKLGTEVRRDPFLRGISSRGG